MTDTEPDLKDHLSNCTDIAESKTNERKEEASELSRSTTPLERFPNDHPEIYGKTMLPRILITAYFELSLSKFSRTNYYRVLFHKSPRQWIHLNISLEIPTSSKYWAVTAAQGNRKFGFMAFYFKMFGVPTSLLEIMQEDFERYKSKMIEESYFTLWLSNESIQGFEEPTTNELSPIHPDQEQSHVQPGYSKEAILSSLHHLGCRKVSTGQVIQLAKLESPAHFIATFEGQLVEEVKSETQPPTEEFCYNIEIHHCLRHEPGITRLVGLAVDNDQDSLHSYLVKLPDTKCELLLDYANRLSQFRQWFQFENLAWQLVHRVNSVHTSGRHFVVGTLGKLRPPILVDAHGQVHIHYFLKDADYRNAAHPLYPPEFRVYAKSARTCSSHMKRDSITKAFDIYQLGLLLWTLADSWSTGNSTKITKEVLFTNFEARPSVMNSQPAVLPRLSKSIPEYFRLMIDECCSESPCSRPRAEELLSRFPPMQSDTIPEFQGSVSLQPADVNTILESRLRSSFCDICNKQTTSITYNCLICYNGDFDLCQQCFDAGNHCNESSHLLRETPVSLKSLDIKRYHSSVDSGGDRHITEL